MLLIYLDGSNSAAHCGKVTGKESPNRGVKPSFDFSDITARIPSFPAGEGSWLVTYVISPTLNPI